MGGFPQVGVVTGIFGVVDFLGIGSIWLGYGEMTTTRLDGLSAGRLSYIEMQLLDYLKFTSKVEANFLTLET